MGKVFVNNIHDFRGFFYATTSKSASCIKQLVNVERIHYCHRTPLILLKYSVLRQCDLIAWISPVGGGYLKTMLTVILVLYWVTIGSLVSSVSAEQELNPMQKVSVFTYLCMVEVKKLTVYRCHTAHLNY